MTSQILDGFIYEDVEYVILGISGGRLFSPEDFDIKPEEIGTACMRGYYSKYSCTAGNLFLREMTITLFSKSDLKDINGIQPIGDMDWYFKDKYYGYKYEQINLAARFTGSFLIGRDYYMSEPASFPHSYKMVAEIFFNIGKFEEIIDRSELIAQKRTQMLQTQLKGTLDITSLQKYVSTSLDIEFLQKYNLMYNIPDKK